MLPHTIRSFFTFKRVRWLVGGIALVGLLALSLVGANRSLALDLSVFELDGNAITNHAGTGLPDDWDRVCHSVSPADCPSPITNANTSVVEWAAQGASTGTTFNGGGSKDPIDVSSWAWNQGTGGLPGKDILLNGFTAEYGSTATPSCPGSTTSDPCKQLFFGMDRFDNSGDAQNGFWFFQNSVALTNTKSGGGFNFSGVHKNGDLLVVSDFSVGGSTATITVYKWDTTCLAANNPTTDCADSNLRSLGTSTAATCGSSTQDLRFCGIVNAANGTASPWPYTDKSGNTSFQAGDFYEGGIDLNAFNLENECFSATLAESRSSTSTSATLKSFVLGSLPGCVPHITTTPQDASGATLSSASITTAGSIKVQDQAATNVTGAVNWSGTVAFSLCGPADLASQASCLSGGTAIGFVAVSNTTPMVHSPQATITSAAAAGALPYNYCWRGVFHVTSPVGLTDATDATTTECFKVTPVTPTFTTQASIVGTPSNSTNVPAAISDTANLTGTAHEPGSPVINPTTAGSLAKGTLTFTAYGPNSCTTVAFTTTANVNGDGAYSVSFTATAPGTYTFVTSYSGDAPNTLAAAGVTCANQPPAESVTATDTSSASSLQNWLPNDTATIVSGSGLPTLKGMVTLQLYDGSLDCSTGAVSSQLYTKSVSAASTVSISSANTSYLVSGTDSVSWKVTFTSSDPNVAASSHCESTSLTVVN